MVYALVYPTCYIKCILIIKKSRLVLLLALGILFIALSIFIYSPLLGDLSVSSGETSSASSEQEANLQHAVIIDAGSSGSRVFIYVWPPHTGDPKELLRIKPLKNKDGQPVVKKIEPGLSSFASDPNRASDYIVPLLQFAAKYIPQPLHVETPVYILATAGLRLLNTTQQNSILEDLKNDLSKSSNFSLAPNNVEIISGKQEGVYQWIAINYVLGRFDHNIEAPIVAVDVPEKLPSSHPIIFRKQTVGIMDMGGASMQIGFEVTQNTELKLLELNSEQRSHLAEFNLGCLEHGVDHLYHAYVTTYLGLGANEVLEVYENKLLAEAINHYSKELNDTTIRVHDPCRPKDKQDSIQSFSESQKIIVKILGTGEFDECRKELLPVLKNLTGCPGSSCVFRALPSSYSTVKWYGFSEFWYSMEDVFHLGGDYNFDKIQKAAKEFCPTEWEILWRRYKHGQYPQADENRLNNQCFKIAWITVVLHEGLAFPFNFYHMHSSPNVVPEQVVHWTLGAVLFRTRFYPLGVVQREQHTQHAARVNSHWMLYLNYYLFIGCFILVISSIILYLRGLRKWCFSKKKITHYSYNIEEGQLYCR